MYQDDNSDVGPRGTFETYRAEGDALYKNSEYTKAIESYTTALEVRRGDRDCLVARSKCYLQLGNTEQALKDAESSLAENKDYHKGLFQKAEALYSKGEFELSLVFYHRGHKKRPELQEFRLGIQKAQEAIDNSVGSPEKVKLNKDGDLSFFTALIEQTSKKKGAKASYARPSTNSRRKQKKPQYKSVVNDKTVKQLLGELYGDRVYLENLLKETDQHSPTGQNIYELVHAGLQYLDTRTDFWRQQKPMYARKRDCIIPRHVGARDNKTTANQYIIRELEKIDEEIYDGKYKESLARARSCMKTVESYSDSVIHNKQEVIAGLQSLMGNAYIELGELDKALHHHNIDLEMAKKNKLKEANSRALDNLGRVYARSGEYAKAIDVWEQKLPLTKEPLEATWLYHEMGRCYLEMGQHEKAKEFGEKSSDKASQAKDMMWQLNATVLVAQAEAKLQEFEAALSSFEKALDMAHLQDDASAEAAIKRAIQDINGKIVQGLKSGQKTEEETAPKVETPPPKVKTPPPPKAPTPKPPTPKPPTPKPITPSPVAKSPSLVARSPSPVARSPTPENRPPSSVAKSPSLRAKSASVKSSSPQLKAKDGTDNVDNDAGSPRETPKREEEEEE
ncbi:hypothetical protein LSH36_389g01003 [Paralvinella palmiformis]|uniref:Outer dynein arm-docking complex subunit 4 n=1 Tax=Paralvinella palmiformis TaxID=53620 RepID=A0AAD9JCT2_9ANNE|nr:hypothetical protein LSH36_389g01003 [Paralvinella palmiformis]